MADLRLGSLMMEDSGEGPAVMMIHGLGGSSNTFQPLLSALQGYRALRPDLPGAGRSAKRPGLPGMAGLVAAVTDCLRLAGAARAHLVGHSMGTLICQYIAAKRPESVASLTLYGPILEPPSAAREALKERAETARTAGMTEIAEAVSSGSLSPDTHTRSPAAVAFVRESLLRQPPSGYADHCEALSAAETAEHGAIQCPTLLVTGAEDPIAPPTMARDLAARIAGSRVEIIEGVAHWPTVEAPQRSAGLLRDHIEAHPL